MRRTGWILLVLAALVSDLEAGGREIHQLCVATGCFAGDQPGLPVEITEPGVYRLTSDIEFSNSSTVLLVGILVDSPSVEIDLGGHAVRANGGCFGDLPLCTLTDPSRLIQIEPDHDFITIRNGTLEGSGQYGIFTQPFNSGLLFEDLRVVGSGSTGIFLNGSEGEARRLQLIRNRSSGVSSNNSPPFLVRDSLFIDNGGWGVFQVRYCRDNVFESNGDLLQLGDSACTIDLGGNICSGGPC